MQNRWPTDQSVSQTAIHPAT